MQATCKSKSSHFLFPVAGHSGVLGSESIDGRFGWPCIKARAQINTLKAQSRTCTCSLVNVCTQTRTPRVVLHIPSSSVLLDGQRCISEPGDNEVLVDCTAMSLQGFRSLRTLVQPGHGWLLFTSPVPELFLRQSSSPAEAPSPSIVRPQVCPRLNFQLHSFHSGLFL